MEAIELKIGCGAQEGLGAYSMGVQCMLFFIRCGVMPNMRHNV